MAHGTSMVHPNVSESNNLFSNEETKIIKTEAKRLKWNAYMRKYNEKTKRT